MEGETVTLDASGSSDAEDDIDSLSFVWKEGDTNLSNEISFSKSDFSVGEHNITLVVTDTAGASSSDNIIIIVTKNNLTETMKISWFLNGQKKQVIPNGIQGNITQLFTWWGNHSIKVDLNNNDLFDYDFDEDYPDKK